jgi:hypothetical protein
MPIPFAICWIWKSIPTLLPADDSSEGFDNIADALAISPALLERYVATATKSAGWRWATPAPLRPRSPIAFRPTCRRAITSKACRWARAAEFWCATSFPLDAEYAIKIHAKAANIGLGSPGFLDNELEVTLNGERIKLAKAAGRSTCASRSRPGRRSWASRSLTRTLRALTISGRFSEQFRRAERRHHRPLQSHRRGRHAQPASHFRLPAPRDHG